jgi:hypothetical protein
MRADQVYRNVLDGYGKPNVCVATYRGLDAAILHRAAGACAAVADACRTAASAGAADSAHPHKWISLVRLHLPLHLQHM